MADGRAAALVSGLVASWAEQFSGTMGAASRDSSFVIDLGCCLSSAILLVADKYGGLQSGE